MRYEHDFERIYRTMSTNVVNVTADPTVSQTPVSDVPPTNEVPVTGDQTPIAAATNVTSSVASGSASDALMQAHSDYMQAYNKYISMVSDTGGSASTDEEMRSNMQRTDVQAALTA